MTTPFGFCKTRRYPSDPSRVERRPIFLTAICDGSKDFALIIINTVYPAVEGLKSGLGLPLVGEDSDNRDSTSGEDII